MCSVRRGSTVAATVAGALAYGVFRETIQRVDPAFNASWKGFCGTPQDWMSTKGAVFNQVVQSAVMVVAVLALGDDQNDPPGAGMHAFISFSKSLFVSTTLALTFGVQILGLLSTTLKLTLGTNAGSALNPAADSAGFAMANIIWPPFVQAFLKEVFVSISYGVFLAVLSQRSWISTVN
jgi:glycerol uptake facilitator-like aquaporin